MRGLRGAQRMGCGVRGAQGAQDVRCMACIRCRVRGAQSMGCAGGAQAGWCTEGIRSGVHRTWGAWDVGCKGHGVHEMQGAWDAWGVGCTVHREHRT